MSITQEIISAYNHITILNQKRFKESEKTKVAIIELLIHPTLVVELLQDEYFENFFYMPKVKDAERLWRIFSYNGEITEVKLYSLMSVDSYCLVTKEIE